MGDTEANRKIEIVMTAGKRDNRAVMRLERKFRSEIDDNRVHHVAGGPYKGILINKTADSFDDLEPAEGRLEFLAYMINEDQNNESVQDYWTLRFWFRGKADGVVKKKTFTDYFQELMNPSTFPKNYIGFIKKALVLLKVYPVIKRVELEVQQTEEPAPEDALPPIKSFTTVFSPAVYDLHVIPEVPVNNKTFLTFMVKTASHACLALSAVYGDVHRKTFEIVIGAESNTKSIIRYGSLGPVMAEAITMNVLSENDFRYFWISWASNMVEVGRGAQYGHGQFLQWSVPQDKQFHVNCLSISMGSESRGQWEFAELLDAERDFGKEAKRNKIRQSLLWIAKKQRILQCLEEAYPNSMTTTDLLRQCKVGADKAVTALVFLTDLQRRGLIREVESGVWLRIQSGGEETSRHEVKVVKDLPQLTIKQHPTIAVVTAMYCEKLAVDAMMEDKTTFVRYKTEGESQVFTIGKIGKFTVVSTKLSQRHEKEEDANIAAENTITRLLGTFCKVDHVIIVGVGGAVPNYTDGNKHVRLGDVVVSLAENNGPLYIHCHKVDKSNDGYKFSTRQWKSKFSELQDVALSIKHIVERDTNQIPPWDKYIEEAKIILQNEDAGYNRPGIKTDKLFYTKPNGSVIEVVHPHPGKQYREGKSSVHYGVIGSGKLVAKVDKCRLLFSETRDIKAYDTNLEAILDSLEGNRNESFIVIRGMADYVDGTRKEWQGYASMAAAAYMKSLITSMS